MRQTLMLGLFVIGLFAGIDPSIARQMTVFQKISPSIVKVEAGNNVATGFIWGDSNHIVTSLHVVDGSTNITIKYVNSTGQIVAASSANVVAVLKRSDLVLLKVASPQPRTPLQIAATPGAPDALRRLDVVGFPLNIRVASNTEVKTRFGGTTLSTILPPSSLVLMSDYPSKNLEIINLEGNLVPGHSGAPIVDATGAVVGVADGGIERGAVGISFGIPAAQLALLTASTDTKLPMNPTAKELFSADLQADIGPTIKIGNARFTKLRRRSYAQLFQTADDLIGLSQLTTLFAAFRPDQFRYDIYQEQLSGATVVIPEGARISDDGDFFGVDTGDARMTMKIQITKISSPDQMQIRSEMFERQILDVNNYMSAVPDASWTYWAPMEKFGVRVMRRAWYRNQVSQEGIKPDKYYFETLASDGKYFLGVAAINNDNTLKTAQQEMGCLPYMTGQLCQGYVKSREVWAKIALAVQFSTFPQRQVD